MDQPVQPDVSRPQDALPSNQKPKGIAEYQGCPAPKTPQDRDREEKWRARLERRRASIVVLTTLLACPLPVVVLLPWWTRAPGMFRALCLGWLLWVLALLTLFRAVVRGVARYQQEVFDLRERGVPLWRIQQQPQQEQGKGDIFDEVIAQEEEQQETSGLGVDPVRLSATFLWEGLRAPSRPQPGLQETTPAPNQSNKGPGGTPAPRPSPSRAGKLLHTLLWLPWSLAVQGLVWPVSHVLTLTRPMLPDQLLSFWQRPEGQLALWLGGVRWWLLGPNVVVVLEDLFLSRYRVLVGPSLSPRTLERAASRMRGNLEEWVPRVLSPGFYSEGFERVRKVWFTEVYPVVLKTVRARTRDGISVQLNQVQARMRLQPGTRMEQLVCRMLLRETGQDRDWSQEWLLSIQGQLELQLWFTSLLERGLRLFVARHSLSQLLTILEPKEADYLIWELYVQKNLHLGPQERKERKPVAVELRDFLKDFLARESVILEDFYPPTWEFPPEVQKRHQQAIRQLREISQKYRDMHLEERQLILRHILEDWQVLADLLPPSKELDAIASGDLLERLRNAVARLLSRWERDLLLWTGHAADPNLNPETLAKYEDTLRLVRNLRRFLQSHPHQWVAE